jgi:pyridoxal/pyridoxine/pyridoxamine kinase
MDQNNKIYPRCQIRDSNRAIGITYDGYVMPCCNIMGPGVAEVQQLVKDKIEQLHVTHGSIKEILESEASRIIIDSFSNNPMPTCIRVCGKQKQMFESKAGGKIKTFKNN